MLKSTARGEQFMTRTGSEATKGSRKGFGLLGGGENVLDHMTPEQQRDSLVAVYKALQIEIADAKAKKDPVRVKRLGVQVAQVSMAINEIRPKRRSDDPGSIANLFVDICREMMTKPQFNAIMDEANRRQLAARNAESPE